MTRSHPSLGVVPARGRALEEDDAPLVRRLAEGDLAAVGVLYDRYHEDVRQFVARALGGHADADDVTHEAFLTLASVAGRYDGRPCAKPFLIGIAAQLVRRRRSRLQRWAQALGVFGDALAPAGRSSPEDLASTRQDMDRFEAAMARLTDEKRIVFLMVEREGLSGEEVARALDIPVNTVWTRLHHARTELRRAMSRGRAS